MNAQLDRLEVLTDEQIDELLAIVEDKKARLEGAGRLNSASVFMGSRYQVGSLPRDFGIAMEVWL